LVRAGAVQWCVVTNADKRGCNVVLEIEGETRMVLSKRYLPRQSAS